jgi:hypothetical protein
MWWTERWQLPVRRWTMAEVVSVKVKFRDDVLEMTVDEARELRNCLDDLLGRTQYWYPTQPYVPYWTTPYKITCDAKAEVKSEEVL